MAAGAVLLLLAVNHGLCQVKEAACQWNAACKLLTSFTIKIMDRKTKCECECKVTFPRHYQQEVTNR